MLSQEAIKTAKEKLKKFDEAFDTLRERLCPPNLSEGDRQEWERGFNDARRFFSQSPQSQYYDLGFLSGVNLREDFFS